MVETGRGEPLAADSTAEQPVTGRWEMSPTTLIVGSLIIFAAVTVLVLALPLII